MSDVLFSFRAETDLDLIASFIAEESGSARVGKVFAEFLIESCLALSQFPGRFPRYKNTRYRCMPVMAFRRRPDEELPVL